MSNGDEVDGRTTETEAERIARLAAENNDPEGSTITVDDDSGGGGGGGGGKDQTWATTKARAEKRYGPLGLSPLKKLEKIKAFEAQLEADRYERKIKDLEKKQLDPTYMMRVMGKAREKAMQAAPRAMMGPQATEIARAGMTGQGSPGALAEAARQVGAGAQQATGQQAVQAGGQASQGALQAQQAMMAHLQARKAAALGQYAPPSLSYGEQLGQELLTTGVEQGIAAFGEKGAEGLAEERRQKEQMNIPAVPETPP